MAEIRYKGIIATSFSLIFIGVYIYPYILKRYTGALRISDMGEYGDVYGGLNTLFTGLAFIGLIVTILQQHREMKETREEFVAQTKQFEEQTRLLNEQIEEQKNYNRDQKELVILQQKKEDVYKRLEYLLKLEENIELRVLNSKFETIGAKGPEYKEVLRETLRGTSALERIYLFSEEPLWSFGEKLNCAQIAEINAHLKSIFHVRSALIPWLQCFCDLVADVHDYFAASPDDLGKYYRLIFHSCTPDKIGLLYLYCGVEVASPYVEVLLKEKMFNLRTESLISHTAYEKLLLKRMIHREIDFSEAQKLWREQNPS